MGPAVSCVCEIGMMPDRPIKPTVGLMPTSPQHEEGLTTDPSVSVPTPAAQKFAETAAPVPELDPLGIAPRPRNPEPLWIHTTPETPPSSSFCRQYRCCL